MLQNSKDMNSSTQRDDLERLRTEAYQVLKTNRQPGSATLPSPKQYPHQWNWDSAFIAIGLAAYGDLDGAQAEIQALLAGQWGNGMLPHIIYHPDLKMDERYFPNRDDWGVRFFVNTTDGPPQGIDTSGITQPPVAAIAVEAILKKRIDLPFLETVYPKLYRYHQYLLTARDPDQEGLAFILHPWESGLDNSPRWQPLLDAMPVSPEQVNDVRQRRLDNKGVSGWQRPTDEDYACYIELIRRYRTYRYDPVALGRQCPFLVQDVAFNAILHRANAALLHIADVLQRPDAEKTTIQAWRARTATAFQNKLWSAADGRYLDFDLAHNRPINQNTIATFIPLFAQLPSPEQADLLVQAHLKNPREYWPGDVGRESRLLIPTTSKNNPLYLPYNYWRGPIWINTNWLVIKGLENYGYHAEAQRVRQDTLSLLYNPIPNGTPWRFWEYFDPTNANVFGTDGFSWSAALAIELCG